MKYCNVTGGKFLSVLVAVLIVLTAADLNAQRPRIVGGDGPGSYMSGPDANRQQVLGKTNSIFDRAYAHLDAGKFLMQGVENYGMIGDRSPYSRHKLFGDLRWVLLMVALPPGPWNASVETQDRGIVDRSAQYNVIEGVAARLGAGGQDVEFSDWESKDLSSQRLFGDERHTNNAPMFAVSTLENSWPEGYYGEEETFSSSGDFTSTPGTRHWPGPWALDADQDSPTYQQPLYGSFTSSKDGFFVMDDKYNGIRAGYDAGVGAPVGFDVECTLYSYAAPLYEDIVFFNYNLFFRSGESINDEDPTRQYYDGPIDNVYVGFIFDADIPGADLQNYQVSPWAIDDYAYLDKKPHPDVPGKIPDVNTLMMYDKRGWTEDLGSPYQQGPTSIYGVIWLKTPNDIGVTDFHFVDQDEGVTVTQVGPHFEEVFYAINSGDVSLMETEQEYRLYFHVDQSDPNYPHIDNLDSLLVYNEFDASGNPYPTFYESGAGARPDIWWTMSGGPLTVTPGDTFPLHVAFLGADDNPGPLDDNYYQFPVNTPVYNAAGIDDPYDRFADMYTNIKLAYELYERAFQGSGPPKTPTLTAKGELSQDDDGNPMYLGEPGQVTLYWDNIAENSIDLVTKKLDFQGYRLWKTIHNPHNIEPEFELIEQWDVIDGITGWDPISYAEWFSAITNRPEEAQREIPISLWLGDDTGVVNSYVDNSVRTGMTYDYAITAYDTYDSLLLSPSNSTLRGKTPTLKNYIRIKPRINTAGLQDAETDSVFSHISGYATGELEMQVIDDLQVTGHTYTITFEADSIYGTLINVFDNNDNAYVVNNNAGVFKKSEEDTDIPYFTTFFDGIGLKIINHDQPIVDGEIYAHDWSTLANDTTYWEVTGLNVAQMKLDAVYELRYFGTWADSHYDGRVKSTMKFLPFQVWNVSDDSTGPYQVKIKTSGHPRRPWGPGETLTFFEPDPNDRTTEVQTYAMVIDWPDSGSVVSVDTTVTPPDTTRVMPIRPSAGDVYTWKTFHKFDQRDAYRFSTVASRIDQNEASMADIKVVPNPYVVASDIELYTRSSQWTRHEVRFINLPEKCTIDVYTLSGDKIRSIEHESFSTGEATWDLLTDENLEISYGVYIYVVKTPGGEKQVGKIFVMK